MYLEHLFRNQKYMKKLKVDFCSLRTLLFLVKEVSCTEDSSWGTGALVDTS